MELLKQKYKSKRMVRAVNDEKKSTKGITLIALVVTIIVLIILAGVSINLVLGENGIITKASNAAKMHKYATYLEEIGLKNIEKELDNKVSNSLLGEDIKKYINIDEQDIEKFAIVNGELIYIGSNTKEKEIAQELGIKVNANLEEVETLVLISDIVNNNEEKQGKKLVDRTGNSVNWAIVTEIIKGENKVNKTYGTGYYYLEEGTKVNGKEIANAYVIDYNNKTIINCNQNEKYSYSYLDINSSLGVTENLIFNLDAQNITNVEDWGEGVSLYKYDETIYPTQTLFANAPEGYDREKITNISNYIQDKAFVFNGNNYIEIHNDEAFDFSKGLTFEFYGKLKDNDGPFDELNGSASKWYTGLFGVWDGNGDVPVRFGLYNMKGLWFNFAVADQTNLSKGSHSDTNAPWNQAVAINEVWNNTKELYFTITLNKPQEEGENANYDIYINGDKYIDNGWINNEYWKGFLNKVKNSNLNYFEIGRVSMSSDKAWSYLVGETYTTRIYNRYLTEDEVLENYNKTLSYRMIEK